MKATTATPQDIAARTADAMREMRSARTSEALDRTFGTWRAFSHAVGVAPGIVRVVLDCYTEQRRRIASAGKPTIERSS